MTRRRRLDLKEVTVYIFVAPWGAFLDSEELRDGQRSDLGLSAHGRAYARRAEQSKCRRTRAVPKSRATANIIWPALTSSLSRFPSRAMLGLAIALIVVWIIVRVFFKITKLVIHVVLVVGLIALAIHFLNTPR
jgi:hypothetical protein